MNELEILRQKVEELEKWKANLERSSSIPLNIDQALRERFLNGIPLIKASTKGNDTEDQAVNEGGVATYNVLKEPDDFLQVDVIDPTTGKTTYYLPVYT